MERSKACATSIASACVHTFDISLMEGNDINLMEGNDINLTQSHGEHWGSGTTGDGTVQAHYIHSFKAV